MATWAALAGSSKTMIRKSVAEILDQHVTFELEAIDRMYPNGDVPSLHTGGRVVYFMKQHLGARGIAYTPLDNGIWSTGDPARVQRIADTLDASKIDAVFRNGASENVWQSRAR